MTEEADGGASRALDARARVLAARAAALARPLEEEQHAALLGLLVLVVGDQRVAVPIDRLREVLPPGPVARLPGSPAEIAGLRSGQGEPLTVALLAPLLGLSSDACAEQQWAAVLEDDTAPVGLLADAALDVVAVGPDELTPAGADAAGLVAAMAVDGTLVLDVDAVLGDRRLFLHHPEPEEEPPWVDT